MSSDDFQTKYASFMESMLKGAVAETTKLYEAMVDELKEEISRIKKENEDLKTRCSQFESAQSQPADVAGEASTPQEENSDADKCDTAIQCDLAPAHTTLVEQCQPMGHLIHDHLYALEDVDYGVHGSDHKYYRVGSSQMGFVHVKQEESSNISLESSVKQEAVDPTVFAGSSNAGSQQASASTTENEEPTNNQTGSQEEISSPQDKGTSVVLELPHLGVHSSDQQHSIVISLASLSQNIKEESGAVHEASAPMQLELILPEELVADRQRDSGSDVNQQPAVQQSENVSQSEEQLTRPVLATQEIVSEKSENVLAKGGPESKTTSSAECGRQTPDKMKQNEIQGSSSDFSQMVLNFTSVRENSFEVSPTIDSVDTPTAKSPQALPGHSEETTSIETPPITEGENAALDHTGNGKLASSQDDMTISEKKKFQKNSIVARLRSHVKAHWEARKSVRKSEEDTESRTPDITPKRPRLSNDGLNNKNAAGEPIISPENTNVKDDISPSTRKASVTPRTSDQCKGGGNPKKGVNEPTIASSRKSKATKDSTPVSSSNSSYLNGDGVDVENKMPESVIPRRSGSAKERGRTTETKSSSLSPRRSNSVKEKVNINESVSHKKSASNKEDVTTKNKKSTSVSPGPSPAKSTRPNKAESSLSPRRSCSAKENVNTKITESFSLSLRSSRSMITRASPEKSKSASVSPWRALSNKGVGKNKKSALGTRRSSSADTDKTKVTRSSCLSPRRSSSLKQNLDTEKTASSSMSTRKSPTVEKNNSPKKQSSSSHQNSSVSPRKSGTKNVKSTLTSSGSSSAKENASHNKKTRSSSLSPVKSNCTKEIDSPKKSISPSESPVKSAVEYEVVGPQTENSTSNPVRSTLMEESAIPDMTSASTSPKHIKSSPVSIELSNFEDTCPDQAESPPVTPRRSGEEQHDTLIRSLFTNRDSRIKQITRESKSFSLSGYSITATWGVSDSVGSPQSPKPSEMSEETTDPEKAEESTPAKKRRVIQGDIGSKKSRKVTSAEKLAKAAKARALAKLIKVNEAKRQTTPSADNQTNSGVKKCRGKVWVPPVMLASEMPPPGSKPWKKEIDTSAFYKDKFVTAPVVSPLQPLSVIGKFLLRNQCGECGRVFANSESLANHVSLHNIQRPFQCKFCGKAFPESKSFKRHDRVHRNGKIHICPQCGKGFVYRFGLSKHIQMVHGRIKPFICQICNKGFYTRRDVEAHIRMHTGEKPFQCTLCERRFIRKVELNVHLRWHNGEKRHWCIFCGKGFLDSNNLKRHVYTHTGEKPYSCPHCPKQFAQTGHMKKHIRNVHGE
ncbi:uncharacterized protein KZ484_023688 isoform 2-T2 [Pholidichthys leucotaenia]